MYMYIYIIYRVVAGIWEEGMIVTSSAHVSTYIRNYYIIKQTYHVGIFSQRAAPAVKGGCHRRHRNALVIVATTNRPHDVRGNDAHDSSGSSTHAPRI